MQGQRVASGLVFGEIGAWLDRHRALAMHAKAARYAHRRRCDRGLDVAALEFAADDDIAAGLLMQQRRAVPHRLFRIDHDRQWFVVDGNQRRCVFGLVAAVGNDADDRLADMADLVARQRKNRRGVIIRHARGRDQRLDRVAPIRRCEHRNDTRRRARRRAIDGADARMRLLAPAERDMHRPRHLAVVGIGAASGEEPRVLGALDARADDFRPGVNFRRVIHGPA